MEIDETRRILFDMFFELELREKEALIKAFEALSFQQEHEEKVQKCFERINRAKNMLITLRDMQDRDELKYQYQIEQINKDLAIIKEEMEV